LDTADLRQFLEHATFFFVVKSLLELALFVTDTLALGTDPRWRQMQQDVGAIDPMAMGDHRVKSPGGDVTVQVVKT
jgi:hypothetical protein